MPDSLALEKRLSKHLVIFLTCFLLWAAVSIAGCTDSEEQSRVVSVPRPSAQFNFNTVTNAPASTIPASPDITPQPVSVDATLKSIISAYDVNYQMAQITELASDKYQGRRTGSAGARAAASYISSQFISLGLIPWSAISPGSYQQHFTAAGLESDNVIGVIPGTDPGGSYVILAGHYDHLGLDGNGQAFNGADDNAAGVAAILETARIIKQLGLTPGKTIVFCAFSGEEQGEYGARALGAAITSAGLAEKVEMINIDGIGATGGSYFGVWDEGAAAAAPLVRTMQLAGQYLQTPVREEGTDIGSDAQPFNWQYGIPAVTVDWDWGSDPSTYHPYYHTIYDDADQIDSEALARATRVSIAGLWLRASQ